MDGTNLRTVMDEHGVVSSVTPLGDFAATLNSLNLAVDRDLWHSLGISSFPAGDRAVGDSWTKSASGGNLFTYRIAEEGLSLSGYSSVVRIHITSTIELDNRQEVFKARKSFYSRGRIGFTGDIYFDVDVGRIVRQAVSLNTHVLTVVVDLDGTPQISHDEGVTNVELTIQ
ncbi:hypothetical protein THSYN_14505 [Candidatus Thiodictyon syntrophicum]|uniref:Uncharacterized protein n=2 Tax=Candidatus Thiodictyon syntrophicum TaxID=1166950 RepID=A0A2K8U8Z6_9GAMM|nr:hypothetical protein THSYN_14505 [Candidatus Thiodictyon syntrophicum]